MPFAKSTKSSKSVLKVPVQKAVSPALSSSPEIVAEEVSPKYPVLRKMPSASPIKVGNKRSAPVNSDSEIEIIESPVKHKKAKMVERPAPGSPEFEDLSPVTISNKAGKVAASEIPKKFHFGSPGLLDSHGTGDVKQLTSSTDVKQKRSRKPSAKAMYMLEAASNVTSGDDDCTPPPAGNIFLELLKNNSSSKHEAHEPEVSATGLVEDRALSIEYNASADEAAENSEDDSLHHAVKKLAPSAERQTGRKLQSRIIESSGDDSDDVPLAMLQTVKKPKFAKLKTVSGIRESASPAVEMKPITPCHLEPFISLVNEAKQRGEVMERVSTMPLYEMVAELLEGIGARNFKCAYDFARDGVFVNPGKAVVDGIGISNHRVVLAGSRTSIIFVSSGCVAACNLIIPGTNGSSMHLNRVKKIGIWPLNEEFDALTAYFGAIYGVLQFYCSFFGDILTFQTQVEKPSSSSGSNLSTRLQSSSTPKKLLPCFQPRTPSRSAASSHPFPPFLRFDEQVPVYDIRKTKFNFTAKGFASLLSLPLYRNGISDLPQNAAVTVGYTANTYPYNQKDAPSQSLALSLNVQFVMLHGYVVPNSNV